MTQEEEDIEACWVALEEKLEASADSLVRQGVIASRPAAAGKRVWVLRFRERVGGRRVCRTLRIGGDGQPELLRRVREWLERNRGRIASVNEITRAARLAGVVARTPCRLLGRGRTFRAGR